MNKDIHWFDLDNTLWNTNAKWWIIDKMNPEKPLLKITQYEGQQILSGSYINDNKVIYYNGLNGWLSNELLTKIKQKKAIDLENIGISFREYQDTNLILQQTEGLFIYIDRLQDIKTKSINLLTARGNKKAHDNLIDTLKQKLETIGITINDALFINDPTVLNSYGSTSEKKIQCLIESIIGYKIKGNAFTSIMCESYDNCYFYDDEDININEGKIINNKIRDYLSNTQPWLKQRIESILSANTKKLILNLVTSNEMNPFETTIIDVKL